MEAKPDAIITLPDGRKTKAYLKMNRNPDMNNPTYQEQIRRYKEITKKNR